jgi:hypothetical protein
VLRDFYVDDAGVPRAQAAQFLANGTGIVRVIEPYLALTIGGPPAIPVRIPPASCQALVHFDGQADAAAERIGEAKQARDIGLRRLDGREEKPLVNRYDAGARSPLRYRRPECALSDCPWPVCSR